MQTFTDSIHRSFAVDTAETIIKRGTRVTFYERAGQVRLKTASNTELAIGTADEDYSNDQDYAAPAQGLSVRLFALSAIFKSGGVIPAGSQIGKSTGGKVITGSDLDYITHSGCGSADELITAFKLQ